MVNNSRPLNTLATGEQGLITALSTGDPRNLRKFMALGIYPGLKIKMIQKYPSYVFQVGFTQIAADHNIVKEIQVSVEEVLGESLTAV